MSKPGNVSAAALANLGVIEISYRDDVAKEMGLTAAMCKTLCHFAAIGGEMTWAWEGRPEGTKQMIATLINRGLLIEREYYASPLSIVRERLAMRLTDMGRNVVTKLQEPPKVSVSQVKMLD